MAEEQDDDTYRQQFAEAVTRLFGNFDPAEQNHRIKREHDHAANESILLGNDRENEIVVGGASGQIAEGRLRPFSPTLARQPACADGNQRLTHLIGLLLPEFASALPLFRSGIMGSKIPTEINQQTMPLVIFQF